MAQQPATIPLRAPVTGRPPATSHHQEPAVANHQHPAASTASSQQREEEEEEASRHSLGEKKSLGRAPAPASFTVLSNSTILPGVLQRTACDAAEW